MSAHDDVGGLRGRPVKAVHEDTDAVVVSLSGELDLYNAEEVRQALYDAADRGFERLVIDLADVTFLDSTALGVMVEARKRLPNRRAFLLATPPREVKRTLEVSGLDRHFGVYETVESALAAKV